MRILPTFVLVLAACSSAPSPEEDFARAMSTRDPREALRLLDRAIASRPQVDYYRERARLHGALEDWRAALADLSAAVALAPDDAFTSELRARLLARRASLYLQMGRAAEADADLSEALRLVPEYTEASLERARLRRKTGRTADAARDVDAARKSGAALADSFYNEAVRAVSLGDAAEAERMIEFTLDLDPGHSRAHIARARLFMEQRRFDEAAGELDRAIPVRPRDPELYYHRGTALLAAARPERALADFEKAVELGPKEAPYLAARGLAKYRAGEGAEAARADFEAALTLDPGCYSGWFNRGVVSHERRELDQAEKELRRAVSIRATPEGSIALGRVLVDREQFDTALDLYRRALEIYRAPTAQKALTEEAERTRRAKEAKP